MSSKLADLNLKGISGKEYKFLVYPLGTKFKAIGGVYYISKRTKNQDGIGSHSPIYVGETSDLSERFDNHHKSSCFDRKNANCISVLINSSEKERLVIEKDLKKNYNPTCND
jgi:excinuclease UvrABC nuclease subunit